MRLEFNNQLPSRKGYLMRHFKRLFSRTHYLKGLTLFPGLFWWPSYLLCNSFIHEMCDSWEREAKKAIVYIYFSITIEIFL